MVYNKEEIEYKAAKVQGGKVVLGLSPPNICG